ncbi:MAG: PAS domain S-box protein [Acidobacteria bacterium]|nr:PAS domain S-box protein [Acidobacteriota bacterium]
MMRLDEILSLYSQGNRTKVLTASALLILAIAYVDWQVRPEVSLGVLYVIPVLIAAGFLTPWQILGLAGACALLREAFGPFSWEAGFATRLAMGLGTFFSSGLLVRELVRNRQLALQRGLQLEEQVRLRREVEEHLRMLIESSPAAILTIDAAGKIQMANEAAHRLLGCDGESLKGEMASAYLPVLGNVPRAAEASPSFRSTMECTGRRRNGEAFLAHIWFSTYKTPSGPWLAAIVLDSSEQLRDREGLSFQSLMTTSRIVVGAMLHEVRNLCAAAAVAHANLARMPGLAESDDFKVLGTLVKGLGSLASSELRIASDRDVGTSDLRAVFNELHIVVEPSFSELQAEMSWHVPERLPLVRGDHHSLLQVFLNLAQNSLRAVQQTQEKNLSIAASVEDTGLLVRFQDTGRGVPVPDRLFQPFYFDSEGSGLGLYVSRAIVRSFGGDLYYEPQPLGSCFVVKLAHAEGKQAGIR